MRAQLIGTWLIGSLVMGTVALILTANRRFMEFRPLSELPRGSLLLLFILVPGMFLMLFALAWRTQEASWLRADPRAPIFWALAVGSVGLVGWGFAAAVTFTAEFSLTAQLILAYVGGGLPFTLIAGMLARRVWLNWVAVGLTGVALVAGLIMMPEPFSSCLYYLSLLFGPVPIPL